MGAAGGSRRRCVDAAGDWGCELPGELPGELPLTGEVTTVAAVAGVGMSRPVAGLLTRTGLASYKSSTIGLDMYWGVEAPLTAGDGKAEAADARVFPLLGLFKSTKGGTVRPGGGGAGDDRREDSPGAAPG
jgi:hypothetical protein